MNTNRRSMLIPIMDKSGTPARDQAGNPIVKRQEYEPRVLYEIITLDSAPTVKNEYFIFGKKADQATPKNYSVNNLNPLDSLNGHILGLVAMLMAPAKAVFKPQSAAGDAGVIADAWNAALAELEVETYKNKDRYQQDMGYALLPPPPAQYRGTGNEPALWDVDNGSMLDRQSSKHGIYFKDPVLAVNDKTLFNIRLNFAGGLDAVLDNHQIWFGLIVREFPDALPDNFNG